MAACPQHSTHTEGHAGRDLALGEAAAVLLPALGSLPSALTQQSRLGMPVTHLPRGWRGYPECIPCPSHSRAASAPARSAAGAGVGTASKEEGVQKSPDSGNAGPAGGGARPGQLTGARRAVEGAPEGREGTGNAPGEEGIGAGAPRQGLTVNSWKPPREKAPSSSSRNPFRSMPSGRPRSGDEGPAKRLAEWPRSTARPRLGGGRVRKSRAPLRPPPSSASGTAATRARGGSPPPSS